MVIVKTQSREFSWDPAETSPVCLEIELLRLSELTRIKKRICSVLQRCGVRRPKKNKWTVQQAVSQNIVGRALLADLNSNWGPRADPLIPQDFGQLDLFKKTINDTFHVSPGTLRHIVSSIDITGAFNESVDIIKLASEDASVDTPVRVTEYDQTTMLITVRPADDKSRSFKLLKATYNKLQERFDEYTAANQAPLPALSSLVAALLIRYEALDTGGHQWAMPGLVKDLLRETMMVDFEMFASAFNHHYRYYCSLFYDIEKYFMSLGPFQGVTFISGCYVANPPYEVAALSAMIDKIATSAAAADEEKSPLSFVFGMPEWIDDDFPLLDIVIRGADHVVIVDDGTVNWFDHMTGEHKNYTPASYRLVMQNDCAGDDFSSLDNAVRAWQENATAAASDHPRRATLRAKSAKQMAVRARRTRGHGRRGVGRGPHV